MAILKMAPTKSNLLLLRRHLAFAEEGFDLLEQKRQILVLGLMSRLSRACEAERLVAERMRNAFAALREAALDLGAEGLDRASTAVATDHRLAVEDRKMMGLRLPRVISRLEPAGTRFGVAGTSASADAAMLRFAGALPLLVEMAELETAVARLARELRKTQRRCNALSKTFIPSYRQTIAWMTGALEERERESLIVLKTVRDRLARAV
jgi:V/A-type H+-transporting ATPase subunit D